MKIIYDANRLVKVEIIDKQQCQEFEYKPERKTWWGKIKPAGFYRYDTMFTAEELKAGKLWDVPFLVVDNVLYYRPYVKLSFRGGFGTIKEFETYEEAVKWGQEQADKGIQVQMVIDK